MKYRSEIDGLRAIAIVPVVFFHSGVEFFKGGYLGVDVFFVISGYLITTLILNDINQGRFSVWAFYERRFRRILPAYVLVLVVSMVFAWLWMMPDELRNFGQSVFASSVFSSNILFWTEAGYFMAGSAEKPLLHTWSLSVEEQFYVFFPLFLLALSHLRSRWMVLSITVLAVLSLGLSEYAWRHFPWMNFYMLPFRAWELGFGALGAIFLRFCGPRSNSIISAAGLLVLVASIAIFNESTPVPSAYALVPVLGTLAIIVFASPSTWVGRLLSLRPIVLIGLISYSTYLWHQPLLAFTRIRSIPSASDHLLVVVAASSFVIGYVSWRYIERPFRNGGALFRVPRARILIGSAAVLAGLAVVGLVGNFAKGFPGRLPDRALKLASFVSDTSTLKNANCAFYSARPLPAHPVSGCDGFLKNGRASVVFIGDSHSGAISYDAQLALAEEGISSYAVSYSGCLGLRGFKHLRMPVNYDCVGYNESMIDYARGIGAKVLVITSRFPLYLQGERFDNGEGGVEIGAEVPYDRVGFDTGGYVARDDARKQRMLAGMREELSKLTDEFAVVLLDPIPEAGWYVPQLAAKTMFFRKVNEFALSTDYSRYKARAAAILQVFEKVDSPRLFRVRPEEVLCDRVIPGRCINANEHEAYYFDNNHPSRTGARLILPDIVAAVRGGLKVMGSQDTFAQKR